jgi:hypothetical protein
MNYIHLPAGGNSWWQHQLVLRYLVNGSQHFNHDYSRSSHAWSKIPATLVGFVLVYKQTRLKWVLCPCEVTNADWLVISLAVAVQLLTISAWGPSGNAAFYKQSLPFMFTICLAFFSALYCLVLWAIISLVSTFLSLWKDLKALQDSKICIFGKLLVVFHEYGTKSLKDIFESLKICLHLLIDLKIMNFSSLKNICSGKKIFISLSLQVHVRGWVAGSTYIMGSRQERGIIGKYLMHGAVTQWILYIGSR